MASGTLGTTTPSISTPSGITPTDASAVKTAPTTFDGALAAALPATALGAGAAHGATDLHTGSGVDGANSTLAPPGAPGSRFTTDRSTSAASITAIRRGHEGNVSSPLSSAKPIFGSETATSTGKATSAGVAAAAASIGQKSTTRGTGPEHTTSLTPGKEHEGVGHPATRGVDGASREPGSYPAPKHDADPSTNQTATATTTTTPHPTAGGISGINTGSTSTHDSPVSHTAATAHDQKDAGHRRTSSTSSNGKKKVGLMNKLKGEMKVIEGKIQNDEKKVQQGEKMKHGGGLDVQLDSSMS